MWGHGEFRDMENRAVIRAQICAVDLEGTSVSSVGGESCSIVFLCCSWLARVYGTLLRVIWTQSSGAFCDCNAKACQRVLSHS